MSREYRDLLVKAAPEGEELEEKARGRGMMPRGGSGFAALRTGMRARHARGAARAHWNDAFNGGGATATSRLPRAQRLATSSSMFKRARRLAGAAGYLKTRSKRPRL